MEVQNSSLAPALGLKELGNLTGLHIHLQHVNVLVLLGPQGSLQLHELLGGGPGAALDLHVRHQLCDLCLLLLALDLEVPWAGVREVNEGVAELFLGLNRLLLPGPSGDGQERLVLTQS